MSRNNVHDIDTKYRVMTQSTKSFHKVQGHDTKYQVDSKSTGSVLKSVWSYTKLRPIKLHINLHENTEEYSTVA